MSTLKTLEKKVVLTQSQFSSRQSAGTLQEGVEYCISDYSEPVQDVQINGTSIVSSGVANIPLANSSTGGICKVSDGYGTGLSSGYLTAAEKTYEQYQSMGNVGFIGKGTLTNVLHAGATTLDSTLVAGKQYILASQSATFEIVLPTTGTYNDEIEVVFPATAAFTPTSSGGTVVGDTLPTTVSGKTYDLLFSWVGSGWLLNWLAW